VRSSFWHPCRWPVKPRRPRRRPWTRRTSRDRRPPASVKRPSEWTIRVCLPSVGRPGYRALGRSRPAPCDANACPVNVHGVVRPAIASSSRAPWACTLRCLSGGCHPRPEPPPTRVLHGARGVVASRGLLWACGCLPISATHDRRAGTPASRESSSARGSRLCPRSGLGLRREPDPPCEGSVTSFTRYGCLHPTRDLPVWCDGKPPSGTGTTGIRVRS
jgi:hypothetical protein